MNIYTVRDNLLKTIADKEAVLEEYRKARLDANLPMANDAALFATIEFLKITLDELYGILNDVQECCKQATEQSWLGVDRQGGI